MDSIGTFLNAQPFIALFLVINAGIVVFQAFTPENLSEKQEIWIVNCN